VNSEEAYTYAWEHAKQNPDGSRVETSIVELLADHLPFDAAKAKLGRAQRVLANRKRTGQTAPDGVVVFPGMEHYAYEPHRVIADAEGNLIENERATERFKDAEASRAKVDSLRAAARAERERNEAQHFAAWAVKEMANGRHPREIVWDTCVRETGLWKDASP
jgi:hypothetical protein